MKLSQAASILATSATTSVVVSLKSVTPGRQTRGGRSIDAGTTNRGWTTTTPATIRPVHHDQESTFLRRIDAIDNLGNSISVENNAVKFECDPTASEADIGILCHGGDCLPDSDSTLGGFCEESALDQRALQTYEDDWAYYISPDDPFHWCHDAYYADWGCNCDDFNFETQQGNITQCGYTYCSGCEGGLCSQDKFWVYINSTARVWQECYDYGEWEACVFGDVEYGTATPSYNFKCSFQYRGTEHCCYFEDVEEGECGFRSCTDSDFPFEICDLMKACPIDLDSEIPWATVSPTTSPTLSTTPTISTSAPSTYPSSFPTLEPSSGPTIAPVLPTLSPIAATSWSFNTGAFPTMPTKKPSTSPPTSSPTVHPTTTPTKAPTSSPSVNPTTRPTVSPTSFPTKNAPVEIRSVTMAPTAASKVTSSPSFSPTDAIQTPQSTIALPGPTGDNIFLHDITFEDDEDVSLTDATSDEESSSPSEGPTVATIAPISPSPTAIPISHWILPSTTQENEGFDATTATGTTNSANANEEKEPTTLRKSGASRQDSWLVSVGALIISGIIAAGTI